MAFQFFFTLFALISTALALSQPAKAQSVLDQSLANQTVSVARLRVPEKANEHLAKAREAALHQRFDEFHKQIALALATYPKFGAAYILKATVDISQHRYDAALDNANTALAIDPDVPWGNIIRASACNGLHRYAEARTLLEHDNDHYNPILGPRWAVLFEQTRAVIGLRDAEAALALSAETLTVVPESWIDNAHLLRANALQINHRIQDAIHEYEFYLASSRPQPLHDDVLAMLQHSQKTLSQTEVATLATR